MGIKKSWKWLVGVAIAATVAVAGAQVTAAFYTVQASAAQTAATVNTTDQTNKYYSGGHIIISVTAYTAGNYTPRIQGKSALTGNYYDILVGPAISATGVTVLKVKPGIATLANGSASDLLPQTWRVQMNGAGGQSMTYSIEAALGN